MDVSEDDKAYTVVPEIRASKKTTSRWRWRHQVSISAEVKRKGRERGARR